MFIMCFFIPILHMPPKRTRKTQKGGDMISGLLGAMVSGVAKKFMSDPGAVLNSPLARKLTARFIGSGRKPKPQPKPKRKRKAKGK